MDFSELPDKALFATGLWVGAGVIWIGLPEHILFIAGWALAAYALIPVVWGEAARMALDMDEVEDV